MSGFFSEENEEREWKGTEMEKLIRNEEKNTEKNKKEGEIETVQIKKWNMVFIQEAFIYVSALAWTMLLLAYTFLWVLHGVCVYCTAVLGCDRIFIG